MRRDPLALESIRHELEFHSEHCEPGALFCIHYVWRPVYVLGGRVPVMDMEVCDFWRERCDGDKVGRK